MIRRIRNEFKVLESQIEPGAEERAWRALIDKVLYDKGDGPKPIVEQLRLRERLRILHARRDRYNFKRYARRLERFRRQLGPCHVIAAFAIHTGIIESGIGLRDTLNGCVAGDRRHARRLLEDLEVINEALYPPVLPWEYDHNRIRWESDAEVTIRPERSQFEESLRPTHVPVAVPAPIDFGFEVLLPSETHAPDHQLTPAAARAAS